MSFVLEVIANFIPQSARLPSSAKKLGLIYSSPPA